MPAVLFSRRCLGIAVAVMLFAVPALLARHAWTQAAGAPVAIAAVQGAVPQDQKWQVENRELTMQRYFRPTDEAGGSRPIILPGAALPALAPNIQDYLLELQEQGRAHHADFAIGLVNYRAETKQYFNGILVLGESTEGWYYKRHLVPFGEYFPVPAFVRAWLRLMSLPYDDFTAGNSRQPTLSAAGQKRGLTICYEDAFGSQPLKIFRQGTLLTKGTHNA